MIKNNTLSHTIIIVLTVFMVGLLVLIRPVSAQESLKVQCGNFIESELSGNTKESIYRIDLVATDVIQVQVYPGGDGFQVRAELIDPANNSLVTSSGPRDYNSEYIDNYAVAATGDYSIRVFSGKGIGTYRILIGCILRNGTVINPDINIELPPQDTQNVSTSSLASSLTDFANRIPIEILDLATIPMIANVPMTGGVAPDGSTILGYTFDAAANDTLALGFTRLSGNLNLGLVVLSADNKVVFQASLVTSSELTTKFTLPTAGTYTIGVFRIDLLPPDAPEATAFQLTAALNP